MSTSILDNNISKNSCDSAVLTKENRTDNDRDHDDAGSDDDGNNDNFGKNIQHSGNT